jgi:hypothetical protein
VRRLTLGEYRELLAGVPTPSREQMEAFARFVAMAHSWYKHLPLLAPGIPMTFFIDPGAGAQRIVDRRGRIHQVDRLERGFHYSWLPTAEYRDRFGYAAFATTVGTSVSLIGWDRTQQIPSDDEPAVFEPGRAELVALPNEVVEVGVAFLSGVVHDRASWPGIWQVRRMAGSDAPRVDWPAESGGADGWEKIIERVHALIADPELIAPSPHHRLNFNEDYVLYQLLTPERERQLRGIGGSARARRRPRTRIKRLTP